jgi:ribonuclease J
MSENTEIAQELGFLDVPPGLVIRSKDIRNHPRQRVCVVAGGCQGEPMSALARMALDDHKDVQIETGDTVILSARMIPGNERAITRMMDHFYRRHAEIYYPDGAQPPVTSRTCKRRRVKLIIVGESRYLHSDSCNTGNFTVMRGSRKKPFRA